MRRYLTRIFAFLFPPLKHYYRFLLSQSNRVTFCEYITFWLSMRYRGGVYWPVHHNSEVTHAQNVYVGINSNAGTRPGCYIQGNGGIWIGNYVHFASNIGVISGNHSLYNQMEHENKEVRIDDYCWIGMNAIILPGVHLGPRTIVGAGSVVTKSFPEGFCVIGGNPAKVIKDLNKELFVPTKYTEEYFGFIPKERFICFAKRFLVNNKYYSAILKELNEIESES